jgi:hypothetical protein
MAALYETDTMKSQSIIFEGNAQRKLMWENDGCGKSIKSFRNTRKQKGKILHFALMPTKIMNTQKLALIPLWKSTCFKINL